MISFNERLISPGRARSVAYTLIFASAVSLGMLVARFLCAGNLRFSGLFGNLLLAWIPLVLALVIRRMPPGGKNPRFWGLWDGWGFWSVLALWILFFPNAFYLVTDLIHIKKFGADHIYRWFDMLMTACFACTGTFLGSLSLYLLHLTTTRRFGARLGWYFAAGMLALGSFGIYLGRELRLNSWDVAARPSTLVNKVASLTEPESMREVAAFSLTFFFFSLAVYALIVSVARLHEAEPQQELKLPAVSHDLP